LKELIPDIDDSFLDEEIYLKKYLGMLGKKDLNLMALYFEDEPENN